MEQTHDARTTPLPIDCHTPYMNQATQRNVEAKNPLSGATITEFSFGVEAIMFTWG